MIIYLFLLLLLLDITPIFQYCQAYFVNHHFCFFEFLYIYTLSEQASFYCLEETRREWIANIQLNLSLIFEILNFNIMNPDFMY